MHQATQVDNNFVCDQDDIELFDRDWAVGWCKTLTKICNKTSNTIADGTLHATATKHPQQQSNDKQKLLIWYKTFKNNILYC